MDSSDTLLDFDKPPILFIGSGMTKRYSDNSPGWEELLKRVAGRVKISDLKFANMKADAYESVDSTIGVFPLLAHKLRDEIRKLINEDSAMESVFTPRELQLFCDCVDPVKIFISSELSNVKISSSEDMQSEIELFKQLPNVVPCVITTNYDTLIEKSLFNNQFSTYSKVSDYYFSDAEGIGEVYKIHGSIDDPKNMIVNDEDYRNLMASSKIITSKILSLLCDFPVIIMGYSFDDPDMSMIIDDLIQSLDESQIHYIEKNIVYVIYDRTVDSCNTEYKSLYLRSSGRNISVKAIRTKDYSPIFQEILEYMPIESPSNIRRYRKMITDLVLDSKSDKACGVMHIGEVNQDSEKIAIAIGDYDILTMFRDFSFFCDSNTMMETLFTQKITKQCAGINVYYFLKSNKIRMNEFAPVFHFMRKVSFEIKWDENPCNEFVRRKVQQFDDKFKSSAMKAVIHDIDAGVSIEEETLYKKPLYVLYLFECEKINETKAFEMLKNLYCCNKNELSHDSNFKTNLKCALTYLPFKTDKIYEKVQ